MKALAESLGVSLPAMSRAVDGLFERGLVEPRGGPGGPAHEARAPDRRRPRGPAQALNEARLSALQELIELARRRGGRGARAARSALILERREEIAAYRPDRRKEPPDDREDPIAADERRQPPLVGARGDVLRAVHDHARQHGRQRRAAVDPAQPARLHLVARVDRQRLHALLRRAARDRRAPRRPLRPPQSLPRRRDHLRAARAARSASRPATPGWSPGARCRASARR